MLAAQSSVLAGRIVTDVPVMTVDFLPTAASLAGIPLPNDRSYDGEDLSPVLFPSEEIDTNNELLIAMQSGLANRTLFHSSGGGDGNSRGNASFDAHIKDVPAMRLGRYKAHFMTSSATGCYLPDGTSHTRSVVAFDLNFCHRESSESHDME